MMPRRRSSLAVAVLVAGVLSVATACGSDKDPEVTPRMTPDEANQQMRQLVAEVMGAAVPGDKVDLGPAGAPIPCGGLEGNDRSKIKYRVIVQSAGPVTEATGGLDAGAAKLRELGYEVDPVDAMGDSTSMGFSGPAAKGALRWQRNGPLSLNVETPCLDDPDR